MKIVSFVSNPDYVRFSKTLTVEHNGIVIEQCYYGTTIAGRIGGSFIEIDDWEFTVKSFMGEEVNPKGFEEMYDKLFKKGYGSFEHEVEEFSKKALITKYFPDVIENRSERYLTELLAEYYNKTAVVQTSAGGDIFRCWEMIQICKELAKVRGRKDNEVFMHNIPEVNFKVRGVSKEYVVELLHNKRLVK